MGRFLQISCWGTLAVLLVLAAQGLAVSHLAPVPPPAPLRRFDHAVLGFLGTILALFTHTLTMFWFIGTGSAVKEAARENPGLVPLYERTRAFKARTSGLLTLAPILLMAASIAGAGVAGGSLSRWIHLTLEALALAVNAWTLTKVPRVVGENVLLLAEANRILAASGPAPARARS